VKAFDKWFDSQASFDLDYRAARRFWHEARKDLKRKLRKLREQQNHDKPKFVRPPSI
jgi:hypothetical protein